MVICTDTTETNGKLCKITTREVSDLFMVYVQTVRRIWKQAKETSNEGEVNVSHKTTRRCGRKRIPLDFNQVKDIPFQKRTTLGSLSMGLGISLSIHKRVKEGTIRHHTNVIKPRLTDENMKGILEVCLSMLDKDTLTYELKFLDMYIIMHIDEKWFYMTKKMHKYYVLPDEEVSYCTCQSKNYIRNVIFLAAMARPRFDDDGNEIFLETLECLHLLLCNLPRDEANIEMLGL